LFTQMDDLLHMVRMVGNILLCLRLFCFRQFWRASAPRLIIASGNTTTFPRIEPMRDGQTRHIKNVPQFLGSLAVKTEEKTMRTLSDTRMLTLFITSAEYPLWLRTEISHKSPRSSWPFCTMLQCAEAQGYM
jgi:hypothetical protein